MATSNIKALIPGELHTVWDFVLDIENYVAWRSDLSKTEVISDKQFIEYTKDGYPTTFTVTLVEPYRRWEFDMENNHIKGHWIGIFSDKGNGTQIVQIATFSGRWGHIIRPQCAMAVIRSYAAKGSLHE